MAQVTALSRCDGQNHFHLTVTDGVDTHNVTFSKDEFDDANPPPRRERLLERLKLMVREAKASGATTFAQIRTYIIGRDFTV